MNEPATLNLQSLRAHKARLGRRLGKHFYAVYMGGAVLWAAVAISLYFLGTTETTKQVAYIVGFVSLVWFMLAQWDRHDLAELPVDGQSLDGRLSGEILGRLKSTQSLTPQTVWQALSKHWQMIFFCNHLLMPPDGIKELLSTNEVDMAVVWSEAMRLADANGSKAIEPGYVVAGLLLTSPNVQATLTRMKLTGADVEAVTAWFGRALADMNREKPYFGGIGRDWANGFTPQLNRFGRNISLSVESGGGSHFGWLTSSPGVTAIKGAFAQGATTIALIGPAGVGKTSHIYALALALLQDGAGSDPSLAHRQIIGLNPSLILSSAREPGELEHIIMNLLGETVHAGNIVLFLDDAQLFFSTGPGSFDVTQILLPVLQNRAVQLILAMTPNDFQRLKVNNSAFAGLLTPVVLQEPSEHDVMRVLEDTALGLEGRSGMLVTYDAIREAYRLSGRYDQDTAYPGKAIQLLEQSLPHANNKIVTAQSVQQAIEQTHGVKVGTAAPVEADELLHLEAKIHERMINQSRAVSVVSAALRRARAGVANPKRPIGSFLFLGPTGVGKTELAKSIAATYFKDETNMIRLDMSEYQQPEDVQRLLSAGANESKSLILAVREQPFSVVLLDEIEKAHPNILNLLLQLLDEGRLTDTGGRTASFKDCIIIATSNAGADTIRQHIERGERLEAFESQFTDQLINSGQFKPELLNRFDEIVLFRPLKPEELVQVVNLMMTEINKTLANQNISVELTPAATVQIVKAGYDPRLGARPMRRMLQRTVEDSIADKILRNEANPGDHVVLDVPDLNLPQA
ncbi:MAG TPA: AAA family ATPase [Candidatus Saccharimonadales bacterium]|jgi:ATP-dependent Clp protease ATP-binding subunit ClpC